MIVEWQSVAAAVAVFATFMTATKGGMIGVWIMLVGAFFHSPLAVYIGASISFHFRPTPESVARDAAKEADDADDDD